MRVRTERKTMTWMVCGLTGALLCAASANAQASPIFSTGFDFSEGFLPGALGGQIGWQGDSENPTDSMVTVGPWFDVFGLQVTADGSFDGAFHPGAVSPVFSAQSSGVTTVLQQLVRTGAGDADFLVQTVDSRMGQPVVQVQFVSSGELLVNGVLTDYLWQADKVMELTISHDWETGLASVQVGDAWVATNVALNPQAAIDQIQFATDDSATLFSSALLVDNIVVLPEPAVGWLLALGAIFVRRRR